MLEKALHDAARGKQPLHTVEVGRAQHRHNGVAAARGEVRLAEVGVST